MSESNYHYPIGGAATQPTGIPRDVAAALDAGCDTIWGEIVGRDEAGPGFSGESNDGWPPTTRRGPDGRPHHTNDDDEDDNL